MTDELAETMDSLTVAADGIITDYSDLWVRGYLKEHPVSALYRVSALEDVIQLVRARAELELQSGEWDGSLPFDADDDHQALVTQFTAHTCNCDWCRHAVADPDPLSVQERSA